MSNFSRRTFLKGSATAAAGALLANALRAQAAAPAAAQQKQIGFAICGIGSLSTGQIIPALTGMNFNGGPARGVSKPTQFCKLVAFITGHREKNLPAAERFGIKPEHVYTYENFDAIKDNPAIDVVYVVTPNSIHKENVLAAAKAGKHVLCEKPMANSVEDCQIMIDAVKKAGKKMMVAYRMQYEPLTLKLIEFARDKEKIGKITHIDAQCGSDRSRNNYDNVWRIQKPLSGGGALMDMGIYALQSARYLTGENPVEVNTTKFVGPDGGNSGPFRDIEHSIVFDLKFPSGATATISSAYDANQNRTQLTAEKGDLDLNPLMNYTGNRAYYTPKGGTRTEITYTPAHHFGSEMDDFAQCILNNKESRTAGDEGLRDMKIIIAAYESAATKKPVSIKI